MKNPSILTVFFKWLNADFIIVFMVAVTWSQADMMRSGLFFFWVEVEERSEAFSLQRHSEAEGTVAVH